jgi:EAL domain-containing protein (putative c-di-GMP-specific phosphodiesterase class I)
MRTQVIPEPVLGLPWLEHFPAEGGPAEKTVLDKSPFIVGRGESADLILPLNGVSREHATLLREGRDYRIRDLGSTNGTFVNGRRVKEAVLHDGDMLQVANVELTFYLGRTHSARDAATQVLTPEEPASSSDPAADALRDLRRMQETLLCGCVEGRLKPIVELHGGKVFGNEVCDGEPPASDPGRNPLSPATAGRMAQRLRHLRRMRGVELAASEMDAGPILIGLEAAEIASGRFVESLSGLCGLVDDPRRLVAAIPCRAAEAAASLGLGSRFRELGIALALCGHNGRDAAMTLLAETRPEYVRLAGPLVRGISRDPKHRAIVQSVVRAAAQSGAKVIAPGLRSQDERAACEEMGCLLGQGPAVEERQHVRTKPGLEPVSRGGDPCRR